MRISRRAFITAAVAAGAAAALGGAATAASAAPGGGRYEPGPKGARVGPLAKPTIPDRPGTSSERGLPNMPEMPDMPDMPHGGPVPAPGPNARVPGGRTGDMIMQRPDGKWVTHLLPFAGPFPDRASAEAEIKRNRDQGLIS